MDLQPGNVVMSGVRSVQVKLVDFGCAHRVTKLGNTVPVVGHPDYMGEQRIASCHSSSKNNLNSYCVVI